MQWASLGVVGGWAWVVALVLVLVALRYEQVAGPWEVQNGVLGFLPAWLIVAALPGLCGGLLVSGGLSRLVRFCVWGAFAAAVGAGITGGRHFESLTLRVGFVALLVVFALAFSELFQRLVIRARAFRAAGRTRLLACALLLVAVATEWVNHVFLVRLYPVFHLGLSCLSLSTAGAAMALASTFEQEWGQLFAGWKGRVGVGLVALVAAICLLPASKHVRGFDNFRWVVATGSPTLSLGLDLASRVAPPPPVDELAQAAPLGSWSKRGAVDFRARSILLVTVDALRADHVGAYGYDRPTTPALDELARTGVRFERAYAPTPHTSYSVTSLLTGKYMRPLLLQGAGQDSDLFAGLLSTYGYKTAGFYPPAVFFIDSDRFSRFSQSHLGFEYFKVEFAERELRLAQIEKFLALQPKDQPVFVWLHLFGPHEPYEDQPGIDFGRRDVDRYDEEVAVADGTIGRARKLLSARDPRLLTIVTADHGEEFGDHGGRYHGTTVYEEQVRVPLIIQGAELAAGTVVQQPVQTIDLLPTVLSGLHIPIPPRVRGRDLTGLLSPLTKEPSGSAGLALAETDDFVLLAEAHWRLICERRSGACQLFDLKEDPAQKRDASASHPAVFEELKQKVRALAASHGKLEASGLRAEGKGWPDAVVRGISGDADAAPELARLLEDADPDIRAKSAEVLFALARTSEAPALRLALSREEDPRAQAYLALTLTRLGQGAPLVQELLRGDDLALSRLAAVALAEQNKSDGEMVLIRWWLSEEKRTFDEDKLIAGALEKIGSKKAVGPLLRRLSDVRLRPSIAAALSAIGDDDAVPFLARALSQERFQSTRPALAQALLSLGAEDELILPLRHFLGVADPMPSGVQIAQEADILDKVGGPNPAARSRLSQLSNSGVDISVVVPPLAKGLTRRGVQVVIRARARGEGRRILLSPAAVRAPKKDDGPVFRHQPTISSADALAVELDETDDWQEKRVTLPERFAARPGFHLGLSVFSETGIEIDALVAVPIRDEVPPPEPEPWEDPAQEGASRDAP